MAAERAEDRTPDVEAAARRLARPRLRAGLAVKRVLDFALALLALVALAPVTILVVLLLIGDEQGWLERRVRLGRDGRPVALLRFRPPPGAIGRFLERRGAREVPLLLAVLTGRLSLVGPRPLPPGSAAGHTGPRRLMAPGLTGPAQRWARLPASAAELDDLYVRQWTFTGDLRLLTGLARRPSSVRQR